jgi:hypothetical protein
MTMDTAQPALPASLLFDDELWETLLELIAKKRVIPIVGSALSVVEVDGAATSIDRFVAERLAQQLGFGPGDIQGPFNLDAVVSAHVRRVGQAQDLYRKINAILKAQTFEPPASLIKLAGITQFRLFVTTGIDSLMECAIDKVRHEGQGLTRGIGYVPSEVPDIASGAQDLTAPTVYHLFGKASPVPYEYVISDDDVLEYVLALQAKPPVRLFDELQSHNLLILGGNFSDWLFRIFLRLAKSRRLSESRNPRGDSEILADEHSRLDPAFVGFLTNFSPPTKVFGAGAPEFIDELWRRWSERFGAATPAAPTASATVFISYARQDTAAALELKAGLEKENFQVWFDQDKMVGGDDFSHKIAGEVNSCGAFIALISRNTEADLRDAYFRLEWHLAGERDIRNAAGVTFIIPVVVDDTPVDQLKRVPDRFMAKHVLPAPGGTVTGELIAAVRTALDPPA